MKIKQKNCIIKKNPKYAIRRKRRHKKVLICNVLFILAQINPCIENISKFRAKTRLKNTFNNSKIVMKFFIT